MFYTAEARRAVTEQIEAVHSRVDRTQLLHNDLREELKGAVEELETRVEVNFNGLIDNLNGLLRSLVSAGALKVLEEDPETGDIISFAPVVKKTRKPAPEKPVRKTAKK